MVPAFYSPCTGQQMVDYIRQTYIEPLSSRLRDTLESLSFLARTSENLAGNDKEEDDYVIGKSFYYHIERNAHPWAPLLAWKASKAEGPWAGYINGNSTRCLLTNSNVVEPARGMAQDTIKFILRAKAVHLL